VTHRPFRAAGSARMAALFLQNVFLVRFFTSTVKEMNSHGFLRSILTALFFHHPFTLQTDPETSSG
jgi:hypothetical protein